jgi:UTP--glucose-1-phosphate uridylyltransferase
MRTSDFHALRYDGTTYDCGDPVGLLRANVAYALKDAKLGAEALSAVAELLR